MRLSKPFSILFLILSPIISITAALNIPSRLSNAHSPHPQNKTYTPTSSPPQRFLNLTFSLWPPQPFTVPLRPSLDLPDLVIGLASPFESSPPVNVAVLRDLLQDFGDNLEAEYPVPGKAPAQARQSSIDLASYTTWTIELSEGLFGYRLPTEWALLALDEVARQLERHGPANLYFSIKKRSSIHGYGILSSQRLGGSSLTSSLANGQRISPKRVKVDRILNGKH